MQLDKAFQRSTRSLKNFFSSNFFQKFAVGRFALLAFLLAGMVGGVAGQSETFNTVDVSGDGDPDGATNRVFGGGGSSGSEPLHSAHEFVAPYTVTLESVEFESPYIFDPAATVSTIEVDVYVDEGSVDNNFQEGVLVKSGFSPSHTENKHSFDLDNSVTLEGGETYEIAFYTRDVSCSSNCYWSFASDSSNTGDWIYYRDSYSSPLSEFWMTGNTNQAPTIDSTSMSPDPALIGESASYSFQASDSDGTVESADLTLYKDGQQVFQDSQSFSSSDVSYTWSDVYVPSSQGDLDARFVVTDDAGATSTKWLNRSLTDSAPAVSISSPGNQTYFSYDRTLQVDTSGGDSVPDESLTCTSDLDGQEFDSRTVTEGETFSTGFDAGLGSHTVQVECTDPNGHITSKNVDFTVKAFELQSVSSSSSVFESANTSYTADFRIGSMVENVSTELNWDSEVRNSEMYSNGGVVENISLTHYFRPPVVQTDGVSKDWFFDYTVDYLDVDGNTQSDSSSSSVESQTVDYAFYGPQISLNKDRVVESGDFEATNSWTEELGVSPAERVSTISFNGSSFTADTEMLEAPIVGQNSTTKTVSGDLTVSFKNQSRTMQSMTDSIDVYKKILTKCGAGLNSAEALKFSLYSEENRSSTMTGNIVYNFDTTLDGDHVRNYAFDMSGVKNVSTCIYPSWAEYKVTGPIQYSSEASQNVYDQTFPDRQYNLYNQTLNSNLRSIDLYLLSDQYATPVYFEVLNQAGEGVSGATVSVNRYFIGEDSYLTVAKSQTDSEGVATTYMRVNEIYYKYTVTKDGEVLLDTDREILTCQSSPCTKTLRINEQEDNPYFVERQGFSYNVTNLTNDQGNVTGVQAFVSHDSDVFKDASLKVERRGSVSTETVCDITSSSNPSTMVCELDKPAGDDYITYVLKASTDGNTYTLDTGVISEPSNIFGNTAYFAAFALFLMFSMIGMASPKIGIIFSTAGILVPWMLGFYALSLGAVGSLVVVALALVVTNNS